MSAEVNYTFDLDQEQPRIQAIIPAFLVERLTGWGRPLLQELGHSAVGDVVDIDMLTSDMASISIDNRRIAEQRDGKRQDIAASLGLKALDSIRRESMAAGLRMNMVPYIHHQRTGESLRPMQAKVTWSILPDRQLSMVATDFMRTIAKDIGYLKKSQVRDEEEYDQKLNQHVFAHVKRRQGVVIETNPFHSRHIRTTKSYAPEKAIFQLNGNLNSSRQQLICVAGIIALTNAVDLLEPESM